MDGIQGGLSRRKDFHMLVRQGDENQKIFEFNITQKIVWLRFAIRVKMRDSIIIKLLTLGEFFATLSISCIFPLQCKTKLQPALNAY